MESSKFLLLIVSLFLSVVSTGQDLEGTWRGELFQKPDKKFYFEIRVAEVDEDGDIISLNLNGEWILKDLKVTKTKEKVNIKLSKKKNILVLHAENLGDQPPNTAAISLYDGSKTQQIILNSDKGTSQAIKISLQSSTR